jgi:hypothetical protein
MRIVKISHPGRRWLCPCLIYLGTHLLAADDRAPLPDNPPVENVEAAFREIPVAGSLSVFRADDRASLSPYAWAAGYDPMTHFQGVQRLSGGWLVVSGSNAARRAGRAGALEGGTRDVHGDLLILRSGAEKTDRLSGGIPAGNPAPAGEQNRIVANLRVAVPASAGPTAEFPEETMLWHPGGMSILGNLLAVPVENYHAELGRIASVILFYDLSDPGNPLMLRPRIDRSGDEFMDKAGGAAMARLPDGRLIVAARTNRQLSLYFSRTTRLEDGFPDLPTFILDESKTRDRNGRGARKFGGSSLQFVRQADGELFLITFGNRRGKGDPEGHTATLWHLNFPGGDLLQNPSLVLVAERVFGHDLLARGKMGDFGAAAGIHVTDDGRLAVYTTARFLVADVDWGRRPAGELPRFAEAEDDLFLPVVEFCAAMPDKEP